MDEINLALAASSPNPAVLAMPKPSWRERWRAKKAWLNAFDKNDLAAAQKAFGDGRCGKSIFTANLYLRISDKYNNFGLKGIFLPPLVSLAALGRFEWVAEFVKHGALRHQDGHPSANAEARLYILTRACAHAELGPRGDAARETARMLIAQGANPADSFGWKSWAAKWPDGFKFFLDMANLAPHLGIDKIDALGCMALHGDAASLEQFLSPLATLMAAGNLHVGHSVFRAAAIAEHMKKALGSSHHAQCHALLSSFSARDAAADTRPAPASAKEPDDLNLAPGDRGKLGALSVRARNRAQATRPSCRKSLVLILCTPLCPRHSWINMT